jgi:hypothetical protein
MDIFDASPNNIWNYKQNHPELVLADCEKYGFSRKALSIVRQSMLCRGINKWLKVRRDLIAYKKLLKHEIKKLNNYILGVKELMTENYCNKKMIENGEKTVDDLQKYMYYRIKYETFKSLLKYKEQVRHDLKVLCMTDRWQIWKGKKLEDMNSVRASD